MKLLLSKLAISPCNPETGAMCFGAWVVKIGLRLFESKESSDAFVKRLFTTQDKTIMLDYSQRIHVPKGILSRIFVMNDVVVGSIFRLSRAV